MRRRRAVAGVLASLGLWSVEAAAQHCAPPDPALEASSVFTRVRAETATFDIAGQDGAYQGISLGIGAGLERLSGEVRLAGYRLTRADSSRLGLGDPFARVRFDALHAIEHRLRFGASLAATVPVGDADAGFGMGHVMLVPGVFAAFRRARWSSVVELGYATALGEGSEENAHAHHAHHAGEPSLGPVVDPMTASELTMSAAASLWVTEAHALRAGAHWALPRDGPTRGFVSFGPELRSGAHAVALEWQVPFAGEPFSSKVVLELSARY